VLLIFFIKLNVQEIQDIQDLRLKLLENMLNELHEKSKNRNEAKLKMFAEMKYAEKEQKLKKLRDKTQRGTHYITGRA
jgi:predicted Holliday junction resolvase-like endonuclease